MASKKVLDENGVLYLWGKIKGIIPTKTSELTNDSGYLTSHQDISGKLDTTGDAKDTTVTFTQAASRANIATGEKTSTLFGKIAKWYADLKTVAFTGSYSDLSNKPTIPTNVSDLTNDSGFITSVPQATKTTYGTTRLATDFTDTTGNSDTDAVTLGFYNTAAKQVETAIDTAVSDGINALDVTDTAVTGQYVSAVSETDGKISVTRGTLPTVPSKVSDLTNDSGFQTSSQVESAITGKGYQTSSEVQSAITSKGYQTSAQVEAAIKAQISTVYKPGGSVAFSALPTPDADHLGLVYNVTDAFTTTDKFLEGSGKSYPAGTNVAVVLSGTSYLFDVYAGFIDLSEYMKSSDLTAITNAEIDTITA